MKLYFAAGTQLEFSKEILHDKPDVHFHTQVAEVEQEIKVWMDCGDFCQGPEFLREKIRKEGEDREKVIVVENETLGRWLAEGRREEEWPELPASKRSSVGVHGAAGRCHRGAAPHE